MVELVDQLALVDDVREPDRGRPVDELERHPPLRMHLPDHLEHQELVEIRVEQRPDRRVDPERMIVDAGCDVRGHCATLWGCFGRDKGARERAPLEEVSGKP